MGFFHKTVSRRKKRNHIDKIVDEFGREFVEEEDIQKVFIEYFSGLYMAKGNLDMEEALEVVEHRFLNEILESLSLPFMEEEVTNSLL